VRVEVPLPRVLQLRLGCREAGDRDAERRAGDDVHADEVAELDGRRLAAVLAADPDPPLRPRPAELDAGVDELADALAVEELERVRRQHLLLQVIGDEAADVVAREAERHLREVVGPEREELRGLGDLVGGERRPRDLRHAVLGAHLGRLHEALDRLAHDQHRDRHQLRAVGEPARISARW
jgi:hypothetical protein